MKILSYFIILIFLLPILTVLFDMWVISKLPKDNKLKRWWRNNLVADLDE